MDFTERINRTMALESLLKNFKRSLEALGSDSDAVTAGVAYHVKFFEDEKNLLSDSEQRARNATESTARVFAAASELLYAARRNDAEATDRAGKALGVLLATAGKRAFDETSAVLAGAAFLRELARDANWRHLEVIDGNRLNTIVVWNGPSGSDARHPCWLASKALKAMLDEEKPSGSGWSYDIHRGLDGPEDDEDDHDGEDE